MASRKKAMTESKTAETMTYRFFLNGEPSEKLPQEALDRMAERLSRVVSQHFRDHPEEYERFLNSRVQDCSRATVGAETD